MKIERLAPGYYAVNRSDQEKREAYSLTREQVKELLAPMRSRLVADEIAQRYWQVKQSDRRK